MATVAERVGRGPCPHCGEPVTFKRSSGKLLNFKCDSCFSTGYSEPGGTCHEKWSRTIKPFATDLAPPLAGDPPPPPPPPARKKSNVFALGDL